jgi:hypothetical protein
LTDARRILLSAIQKGLAMAERAYRLNAQLDTDLGGAADESLALEAAARIASDMVLAGQGRDVLALWASVAVKSDGKDGSAERGTLAEALRRLPGSKNSTFEPLDGAVRSPADSGQHETSGASAACDGSPTDYASVGTSNQTSNGAVSADLARPFFHPQSLIPGMVPLAGVSKPTSRLGFKAASLRDQLGERDCELDQARAVRAGDGASAHAGGPPAPPIAPL